MKTLAALALTLAMLATLCVSALAAQSIPSPSTSAEEVEASLYLDRAQRKRIQSGLRALGFNPGSPDGLFGPRTRKAIGKWQSSQVELVTGYLDASSAAILLEAGEAASPPGATRIVAQEVMDVLSETLRTARSIKDASFRAQALSAVAQAQAKAGDSHGATRTIAEALRTARSITDAYLRPWALSGIAEAQAQAGDSHGATRTITEALSTARSITVATKRAISLITIAQMLAKTGDSHGATRIITEALSTARSITDASMRGMMLGNVAEMLAKTGDSHGATRIITEALSTARSITDAYLRAQALSAVARAQAEAGDITEALRIARSITDAYAYFRAGALSAVARAQAEAGDITEALRTARSITVASTRGRALGGIAEAQAQGGDITEALRTARSITASNRGRALGGIAEAQAQGGDITEALRTARGITDATIRARALGAVAEAIWGADSPTAVAFELGDTNAVRREPASGGSTSSGERWGGYMTAHVGSNRRPAYAMVWNYPSRESAMQALEEKCRRACRDSGGCLPGGAPPCDEGVEYVERFSTSAPYEDDYNTRARCAAVMTGWTSAGTGSQPIYLFGTGQTREAAEQNAVADARARRWKVGRLKDAVCNSR